MELARARLAVQGVPSDSSACGASELLEETVRIFCRNIMWSS